MDNRVIPYRKRERSKKIRWMEKKKRKKIAGTIQSQEDARFSSKRSPREHPDILDSTTLEPIIPTGYSFRRTFRDYRPINVRQI